MSAEFYHVDCIETLLYLPDLASNIVPESRFNIDRNNLLDQGAAQVLKNFLLKYETSTVSNTKRLNTDTSDENEPRKRFKLNEERNYENSAQQTEPESTIRNRNDEPVEQTTDDIDSNTEHRHAINPDPTQPDGSSSKETTNPDKVSSSQLTTASIEVGRYDLSDALMDLRDKQVISPTPFNIQVNHLRSFKSQKYVVMNPGAVDDATLEVMHSLLVEQNEEEKTRSK